MKSSKSSKTEVDDISRETQRLISDSHVRLPYHKPKQKSLKDFLNRQKISKECQVSITGSKKLLQKAWELIENKEKNVEKFYNEDCIQDENNDELCSSNGNNQAEENVPINNDNINNCDEELILDKKLVNLSENSNDDEEYDEKNSMTDSELSTNNGDNDEINFKQNASDENLENHLNYNDSENENSCDNNEDEFKKSMAKPFIDDEAELSESDYNSDNEDNVSNFIDDSDDEDEFSKKKKRKLIALSESEDENDNIGDENSITESQATNGLYKTDTNVGTQQLLGLCSGQFQTQQSGAEENDKGFEDEFDSEVPENDVSNTPNDDNNTQSDDSYSLNDDFEMPKLTSIKDLFKDEEDDFDDSQNDDNLEELPKITSIKDVFRDETDDSDDPERNKNYNNEDIKPKPTSAKDFFDDEAELSESDWSSDDEDHLIETIDKLEEEEGDKDKLDEDIVKDGLDKIYMRQLLDDDQKQVTALKEMLLEDGDLHSDSGRKRKFQWEETDQNDAAFKKPLFSDNEDEDGDEVLSEDEKLGNWRNERFKREFFLSQQNEEYDQDEEKSNDILQTSVSFAKKTHIVKYSKIDGEKISNTIMFDENNESMQLNSKIDNENEINISNLITDRNEINNTNKSYLPDLQITNIASKLTKVVKGSFMKHNNNKMNNTLLYINKKPLIGICDEKKNGKFEDKREMKSMSTITAKASSNPFAYLLRNDGKQEFTHDVMNVEKTENVSYHSKPKQSTNVPLTHQIHQTKIHNSMNSILKQLE